MRSPGWKPLSGLLLSSGVLHFVRPEPFVAIVPRRLGHAKALVYVSGAAEIGCAAAIASRRTRRAGGLLAAALLVAVFPANVQMAMSALRSSRAKGAYKAATVARLPLQAPLVAWALRVARVGKEGR
jgi:uncharacterized membrane protein